MTVVGRVVTVVGRVVTVVGRVVAVVGRNNDDVRRFNGCGNITIMWVLSGLREIDIKYIGDSLFFTISS